MSTLIRFFVELCHLRRGPQDLPGASALLGLVLVLHLVSALLVGLAAGLTAPIAQHGVFRVNKKAGVFVCRKG